MDRELQAKLDAIAELYRAKAVTDAAFDCFYCWHPNPEAADPEPKDRDSEDYFRWAYRKDRACTAAAQAGNRCREACDAFFAWYQERADNIGEHLAELITDDEAREECAAHGQFGMGA